MSTNRVMVRFDTTLQVTLPHCDECAEKESESGENVEPCERCREAAVSAAVSVIRGSWAVQSEWYDTTKGEDDEVDVYSGCTDSDVEEVWIE